MYLRAKYIVRNNQTNKANYHFVLSLITLIYDFKAHVCLYPGT